MQRLFKQFSFPGGIPSHVAPETPGSIHEGGELGYSLSHAYGAAFDNPDLVVAAVVGDGEAETGPLATSWHSTKFVDPARDGAVLPILHLNGYKIANPTVLARIPEDELDALLRGYGHTPYVVSGDDPADHAPGLRRHARPAASTRSRTSRTTRARRAARGPPVLADDRAAQPQGLDRPEGGRRRQDRGLLALPPGAVRRRRAATRAIGRCSRSGCAATGPRSCSTPPAPRSRRSSTCTPTGQRRMSANPHANGGLLLRDLRLPDFRDVRRAGGAPGHRRGRGHPRARRLPARRDGTQRRPVPRVLARREQLQPPPGHPRGHRPRLERRDPPLRRPPRARRPGDGDPLRAHLPGLARGLPADRPARLLLVLRGVRPHRRLDVQPARQVDGVEQPTSRGVARSRR